MGQANSKIKASKGFMSPNPKKQKRITTDDLEDVLQIPPSFDEAARDAVYTNRDLFSHIASFLTIQDLMSFVVTNQEMEQAVGKFLSHWECSKGECRQKVFEEGVDFYDSVLPATCDFCHGNFCVDCSCECSDCGVASCDDCCFVCWCSVHKAFHCEDCNPTRYCARCKKGYCRESEVDTHWCAGCRRWKCTTCDSFHECNLCGEIRCRFCSSYDFFAPFCEKCNHSEYCCLECSPAGYDICYCWDDMF